MNCSSVVCLHSSLLLPKSLRRNPDSDVHIVIVRKIQDHAEAVSENDSSVAEAGRRAGAIREVVERVLDADFPSDNRSLVLILEELAELESIASKWSEKGYWTKRLGVSFSAGTTKACKYDELFRKHFEVGGGFRHTLLPMCGQTCHLRPCMPLSLLCSFLRSISITSQTRSRGSSTSK